MSRAATATENQALVTTGFGYVSLHTADPGTTGASEVSGGAYARVAVTWTTPASGSTQNVSALSINLPASTAVGYFGVWDSASGGNYKIGGVLTPSIPSIGIATVASIAAGALTYTAS